jgi:hypothetical protein
VAHDVGAPQPIRAVGDEPPPDQVLVRRRRWPPASAPAIADADQPGTAHQPSDPFAAAALAEAEPQFGVHPRSAIGAAGGSERRPDGVLQLRIDQQPQRRRPPAPGVVTRVGHA